MPMFAESLTRLHTLRPASMTVIHEALISGLSVPPFHFWPAQPIALPNRLNGWWRSKPRTLRVPALWRRNPILEVEGKTMWSLAVFVCGEAGKHVKLQMQGAGFLHCEGVFNGPCGLAQESLMGVRTVSAFGTERFQLDRFERELDSARRGGIRSGIRRLGRWMVDGFMVGWFWGDTGWGLEDGAFWGCLLILKT